MDSASGWNFEKVPANFEPLSPLSFLMRSALIYPSRIAVIYGDTQRTYREFLRRCEAMAGFIAKNGVGTGQVVSVMLPNTPEMLEMHYAGISSGTVLHTISTRLDASAIRFQLEHAESKMIVFDREYVGVVRCALAEMVNPPIAIEVVDPLGGYDLTPSDYVQYEQSILNAPEDSDLLNVQDEWQAIALSYTSGTTGNPKGVVTHHRGAYLNAMANAIAWSMPSSPVYLWVLPMFHCDGWCFPWTITLLGGTHVCLRRFEVDLLFTLVEREKVTHMCAAPIVLSMLANDAGSHQRRFENRLNILTAGSSPPPAVIEAVEGLNSQITQVYGLTETYSSTAISAWNTEWDSLPPRDRSILKARQGVQFPACEELDVVDSDMNPVPWDGETLGQVVVRGNTVMKGYLKNLAATEEAFKGKWFQTGDVAIRAPDGYITIKDRTKDMINSGGEKISSIEIEEVLFEHPAILEASVIAAPDQIWGERPWAFVSVKPNMVLSEEDVLAFCRARIAKYKVPKRVVFGPLARTATGKVQKFKLRSVAIILQQDELSQSESNQ